MSDLPAAPVPSDADLRHFPDMPLDVIALRDSTLAATGSPADNWYAVSLWCAAWHQVPAGSLPKDDETLAYLAGLGRDVRTWRKHRAGALRGFVPHADGRLYHPIVTAKVMEALDKSRAGTRAVRKRWSSKNDQVPEKPQNEQYDRNTDAAPPVIPRSDQNGSEGIDDHSQSARASAWPLAIEVLKVIGADPEDPNWFGTSARVEVWLARGWDAERDILPAVKRMAAARGAQGPPGNIAYVEKVIATYIADLNRPLPEPRNGAGNHHATDRPVGNRKSPTAETIDSDREKILRGLGFSVGGLDTGLSPADGARPLDA